MTTTPLPEPAADDPLDAVPVTDHPTPRPYLELRPTASRLNPRAVEQAMTRLHTVLHGATPTGLANALTRNTTPPIVEWLLVADGRPDPSIRALVGSTDEALIPDLQGVLRTLVPNTYELRTIEWHPRAIETRRTTDAGQPTPPTTAAVEYRGQTAARHDYLCPITPISDLVTADDDTDRRLPLATLVDRLTAATVPVIFQVLCTPYRPHTAAVNRYRGRLQAPSGILATLISPVPPATYEPGEAVTQKLAAVATRDPTRTFHVTARAVALSHDRPAVAADTARQLATVFGPLAGPHHAITGRLAADDRAAALLRALYDRTPAPVTYAAQRNRLRRTITSPGIVLGPDELAGLCVLDGASLTPDGRRALAARHDERTALPPPTPAQLAAAGPPGQALGVPLSVDREPLERAYYLAPALQRLQTIVVGATGVGKTVVTTNMVLSNHGATAGPEVVFDLKGGGTSRELLAAHYAAHGSLDDVVYFDCQRVLPALAVLDIGPLLDAGIPREEAHSRITGHYLAMLTTFMGYDRFWGAVESPDVIRNHLRALFDPINGRDHVTNADLFAALRRTQRDGSPPAVAEDGLADYFASLLDRDRDVFNRVLGGALNRVETIATDGRLAPMFDHRPDADGPRFDFADFLDDPALVIFDFGGMEPAAKATITDALLSSLWRALHARAQAADPDADRPHVTLYLEEAGAMGGSAILDTLLSQGRGFGLSTVLGVQFLAQLDAPDPDRRTDQEALNETATIIAGRTTDTADLARALATEAIPADAVARRLARLPRGEWLVRPAAGFGVEAVPPFLMRSLPAPPGHPASDAPLPPAQRRDFEAALAACAADTCAAHGLPHREPDAQPDEDPADDTAEPDRRTDTAYAVTKRLPPTVDYLEGPHALTCTECANRFDPDIDGMLRAIACHSSLDAVDRDDIPIGPLAVKQSAEERAAWELTLAQFLFLQAVNTAQHNRFHPLEYDFRRDSMVRLREYVGIGDAAVQELLDRNLLVKDTDHPFMLYSVTSHGREVLGEHLREGVDYGPGLGDLGESTLHKMAVTVGADYLEQGYRDDPDSPVVRVERYVDLGGNERLDAAGFDADGDIVVTLEAERINHDWREAIPSDYDKMAACDPDEAIWIVMTESDGHRLLEALGAPPDGHPRVSKTYAKTTPLRDFAVDEPGLTTVLSVDKVRKQVIRPDGEE